MILNSLVQYYELLQAAGEISNPGYAVARVSFAVNLSPDGILLNVIPLKVFAVSGRKRTEIPQLLEVPEQETKTSGVKANFLCENSRYVLGVDFRAKPDRVKQCFDAFRELHRQILSKTDCIPARAVLLFLDSWRPDAAAECMPLKDCLDELTSGENMVFSVAGHGYVHENDEVKKTWTAYKMGQSNNNVMQCLITGQFEPIERVHAKIKGVRGAQSVGASLVAFNDRAYESYGHDFQQGLNAPVGEYAVFAYTTALNSLLRDGSHKQTYGDTTVVYWAKNSRKIYRNLFKFAINPVEPSEQERADSSMEGILNALFQKIVEGKPIDASIEFDSNTQFYILGLSPNAARLSVRFFLENTFGSIIHNIVKHYKDLDIERSPKEYQYLPLWKLMSETVSPKSKDKAASPLLSGAVLRSIFLGLPYPEALYNSVMIRIRAEREINRGKAAIIKACLIRSSHYEKLKEVLVMSLNEESSNKAYVLGRLFAVLEKAQQDALPGINATIKERYFTSACATPACVFPILLRLSHHHISKSNYGYISERRIKDLMEKLSVEDNPFPRHFTLEEQGVFILGYYHQQKANYAKKDKEEKEND